MYCGSCFRDNALAAELMTRGHAVTLLPLYTPTRTDERNVSAHRVHFGGISVYLQQHSPFFRKTPWLLDRLWDAPGVIRAFASRAASTDARLLGDLTVSMLRGRDGVLRKEFDKLTDWMLDEPTPDVINLPNSLLIGLAEPLRQAVARPVCCTLQGEELFLHGLAAPYRETALALIREQVRHVDRFIAVSEYCAAFMSDFLGIPAARISVVPLGISMGGYARRQDTREEFRVGYFARVAPEKGLHVLADAYIRLRRRTGRARIILEAAGHLASTHTAYLNDVRRTLDRAGLGGEFTYRGELDRAGKLAFLRDLDVLSVPATYDEPKGMFLLEAMASGVPSVQPRRGGFTEIIERTGGGLLVPPDDAEALSEAIESLWSNRGRARTLGDRAYAGVRAHHTIAQSADRLLAVYRSIAADSAPVDESVA